MVMVWHRIIRYIFGSWKLTGKGLIRAFGFPYPHL